MWKSIASNFLTVFIVLLIAMGPANRSYVERIRNEERRRGC